MLNRQRTPRWLAALAASFVLVITSSLTTISPAVAAPTAGGTGDPGSGLATGDGAAGATSGAVARYKTFYLNGGYVAAGVGLRNLGSGTISLRGIPSGAKVKAAYLYWSILGGDKAGSSYKKAKLNGHKVTGTMIGSGPSLNWGTTTKGYAYRATVTKWVKKNGSFKVSGIASSLKSGSDPFTTPTPAGPLAEGASLVVVFSKSSYPKTRIVIANGYTRGSASLRIPFGFTATNPVGQVRTTFVVADGQLASEPSPTVNGSPLAVKFAGADPAKVNYSQGNLWDTRTADVVDIVKPGQTGATIGFNTSPDALAWVAQVFSIGRDGRKDTDKDKLLDGWEANGYDYNGDGTADLNLPGWGASVVRKDLFVEMDYMGAGTSCSYCLAAEADLDRIVKVFATAPQAKNPDGRTGIALHLDAGAARSAKYNLGGGNLVPFDADLNPVLTEFSAIKSANFSPARARIFYYMIWANGYGGGSSSGNAFNIPSDSFVVTLGLWGADATPDAKVGTFVHEFGHALGQKHGGDDHANYEPNYLSVMNYSFQISGVLRTGTTPPYFGYSSVKLPSLKESKLDERKGLRSSAARTYRAKWVCPGAFFAMTTGRADRNVDWNCDGRISSSVSADINYSGARTTLGSWNNWGNLVYGGGAIGGGPSTAGLSRGSVLPNELTLEESRSMQR